MSHQPLIRTFARLYRKDAITEWWTVTNEAKLYDLRDNIPFANLYANDGEGGFIVYLDKPKCPCPHCPGGH